MFLYLSKLLPLFIYPIGFACITLVVALIFWRRRRWAMACVIVALMTIWFGGNRFVAMALAQSLELRVEPLESAVEADVILVLGGATRAQSYPRPISEISESGDRLLYAAYLYQQGVAPKILLSGGGVAFGESDRPTEAESMAEILAIMGVPPEALWLETSSRNTYENAVESVKFLTDKGIDVGDPDSIILVTSASHMPRSVAVFEKQGAAVNPAPTDYLVAQADWDYYLSPDFQVQLTNLVPNVDNLELTSGAIREYIGIVIYRLRNWL